MPEETLAVSDMYVSQRERGREGFVREGESRCLVREKTLNYKRQVCACVCMRACVYARERVCVCVC